MNALITGLQCRAAEPQPNIAGLVNRRGAKSAETKPAKPQERSAAFRLLRRPCAEKAQNMFIAIEIRTMKRPKGRARALERERALEGESPSVAVLPATS